MSRRATEGTIDVEKRGEIEEQIREEAIAWADWQRQTGAYPGLTPEMLRAVYVMVHPLSGSTIQSWARIAGVSRNTWARYRDRDEWKRAVADLQRERRGRHLALADRVIEELTSSPDVDPRVRLAAVRTIYEREGMFVRRVETTHREETPAEREARRRMQARLGQAEETAADEQPRVVN